MRIAMVGPFGLHPNKTMTSRALGLARPLAQQGHDICLFMPPWQTPDEAGKQWQEDGVAICYVSLQGGVMGISHRLLRHVLAWQPDVVHCFKPKAYSGLVAWGIWQFYRHRCRLVVDTDDWEGWGGWNDLAPYTLAQKHFFAWQERWGMRHCHALTVASRTLQSLAWAQGIPPEQVFYVPNGPGISEDGTTTEALPADIAAQLAQRPIILLYSRLFEFDTARLVHILQGVQAAVPHLAVLAVGAGLYEKDAQQLRQQLQKAHLQDALIDVGWIDLPQLPTWLKTADVGIYLMEDTLINRTKCPVKLADMLAVGVPVVAEAIGQVPEYVLPHQTGLLRPGGDTAGLTADLIHLLQDKAARNRLGHGAQRHIQQHFNWQRLSQLLLQAY